MELRLDIQSALSTEIFSDMQKQFPPGEMKTFAELSDLFRNENYKLTLAYDNKELVGYVIFLKNDYIWIDYIAIFDKYHSMGYGSKILEAIFEKYSYLKGCFFEVEPEDFNNIQTIKRLKFYKKLGCKKLNFEYYFPNDLKELRLELLYKSFDGKIPSKTEILQQVEFVFDTLHSNIKTKFPTLEMIKRKNF